MSQSAIYERLLAEMKSGETARLPRAFQHLNGATREMRGPIDFVPVGTLVSMKIEVPDNQGGKRYGLVWRCKQPHGLSVDEARQEIMELLVANFLNLTLPLPR